jgi:CheY-like chemotaxis protein
VAPLRILVAEDNEFNVRHLQRLLTRQGHHVRQASNGREALDLLGIEGRGSGMERPLAPDFDVLLLDLHMPELDGFHVIRAIREREETVGGHLPVIALTARSRQEDRENCLRAGMDDYLTKPIRAAELFAAIDRVVSAPGVPRPTLPDAGGGDAARPRQDRRGSQAVVRPRPRTALRGALRAAPGAPAFPDGAIEGLDAPSETRGVH